MFHWWNSITCPGVPTQRDVLSLSAALGDGCFITLLGWVSAVREVTEELWFSPSCPQSLVEPEHTWRSTWTYSSLDWRENVANTHTHFDDLLHTSPSCFLTFQTLTALKCTVVIPVILIWGKSPECSCYNFPCKRFHAACGYVDPEKTSVTSPDQSSSTSQQPEVWNRILKVEAFKDNNAVMCLRCDTLALTALWLSFCSKTAESWWRLTESNTQYLMMSERPVRRYEPTKSAQPPIITDELHWAGTTISCIFFLPAVLHVMVKLHVSLKTH